MRTKQEVMMEFYSLTGGETGVRTNQELREYIVLETLLNIRDLLSERHTRREKEKVCGDCGGTGFATDFEGTLCGSKDRLKPIKVPCPSCHPDPRLPINTEPHA